MYEKKQKKRILKVKTKPKCYSLFGTMAKRYVFWELIIIMLLAIMLLVDQEDLHDGLQSSLETGQHLYSAAAAKALRLIGADLHGGWQGATITPTIIILGHLLWTVSSPWPEYLLAIGGKLSEHIFGFYLTSEESSPSTSRPSYEGSQSMIHEDNKEVHFLTALHCHTYILTSQCKKGSSIATMVPSSVQTT